MAEHVKPVPLVPLVPPVPPIDLTHYACQTLAQRFSTSSPLIDSDDSHYSEVDILPSDAEMTSLEGAPKPSYWRTNLVALSQKYNMYFAAFMDTIHITIPQGVEHILPGVPDLVLRLPVSKDSQGIGYIDQSRPHCVNNMMIGNLGDKEILLFCSDDGDVTAYYTHLLAEELQRILVPSTASSIPIASTQPFFLENVGMSAWGLAIHQKSRLIAVSSNKKEVTVFVHGTYSKNPCNCDKMGTALDSTFDQSVQHAQKKFPVPGCSSKGFIYCNRESFANSLFPLRTLMACATASVILQNESGLPGAALCSRNFRIILHLGDSISANIPAIAFADDKHGLAESIIATDIRGNLWSLGIWDHLEDYKLIGSPLREDQGGWGVMTIPLRYFRQSPNLYDALGMVDMSFIWEDSVHNRTESPTCLDITSSMRRAGLLPGIQALHRHSHVIPSPFSNPGSPFPEEVTAPNNAMHETQGINDGGRRLDEMTENISNGTRSEDETLLHVNGLSIGIHSDNEHGEEIHRNSPPNRLGGLVCSKDFWNPSKPLDRYPERFTKIVERKIQFGPSMKLDPILSDGAVILRTWKDRIELVPSIRPLPPVVCSHGSPGQVLPGAFGHIFEEISRINMMALIPELSLVVVASANGQAALLTLTKVDNEVTEAPFTGFRVEALLPPRYVDDLAHNDEPKPPLLGLAVSPLPRGPGIEMNAEEYPTRWRLIMQSYDYTIWTYELSRDEFYNLHVF